MRSAPSLRALRPSVILLVDDNEHGLIARKTVLEQLGYRVIGASTGSEALELFESHKFDLVVTDYRMPGMDGAQLIQQLRARNFTAPIILLSGFVAHLGLSNKTTGADMVIQKSASETDQLVRGVKRLLNAPRKPVTSQASSVAFRQRATKA